MTSGQATVAPRRTARAAVAAGLVIVACIVSMAAVAGAWAHRNLLDTDRFVARAGPAIEEPAVQESVATFVTDQLMELVDPEALFTEALGDRPRARLLAVPLAGAVELFVRNQVEAFVGSDTFAAIWTTALEQAHRLAVRVLEGDAVAIQTGDGEVRLDLTPVVEMVLARVAEAVPELVDAVAGVASLTGVSADEARAAIEQFVGHPVDNDFGRVLVYDDGRLEAAQQTVERFDRLVWLALALAPVAAMAALWLSPHRRRTGLQLIVGLAIGLVLLRRVVFWLQAELDSGAQLDRTTLTVLVNRFAEPLLTFTGWAIVALVVGGLVLAATGPYHWARWLRASARITPGG